MTETPDQGSTIEAPDAPETDETETETETGTADEEAEQEDDSV